MELDSHLAFDLLSIFYFLRPRVDLTPPLASPLEHPLTMKVELGLLVLRRPALEVRPGINRKER